MDVQVNWLAVVLAVAASMVVGFVWYAKPVFGNTWGKLVKMDDKKMQAGMGMAMAKTLVASFLTAFILAHLSYLANAFYGNSFMMDTLTTAFWVWLGLAATTIVVHDSFEQRPTKLTLINIGNSLVTLLAMGLVIGWLKP